jgi:5-bromo-4-chloroindolyl phosphate hydrolysis protein
MCHTVAKSNEKRLYENEKTFYSNLGNIGGRF